MYMLLLWTSLHYLYADFLLLFFMEALFLLWCCGFSSANRPFKEACGTSICCKWWQNLYSPVDFARTAEWCLNIEEKVWLSSLCWIECRCLIQVNLIYMNFWLLWATLLYGEYLELCGYRRPKHGGKSHLWGYLNEDIYWREVLLKVAMLWVLQFTVLSQFLILLSGC